MEDQLNRTEMQRILDELRRPFHPSQITWKPGVVKGERALALAYADLRAYMNRLDEVCGVDWMVAYEPWGEDRIICRLTIMGVTRSSTGETNNESEKSEIGGTVAEAQAFKRASAMFGLGRYLYNLPTGWADFDPATKRFTDKAKAKLTGILVQQYRRATDGKGDMAEMFERKDGTDDEDGTSGGVEKVVPDRAKVIEQFDALGAEIYGKHWANVRERNVLRISKGKTKVSADLTVEQLQQLTKGMQTLRDGKAKVAA